MAPDTMVIRNERSEMNCPMCGRDAEADRHELEDSVYVFCCEHCVTRVLRTFAAHDPDRDDSEVA